MTTIDKVGLPRLDSYFWAGVLIWAGLIFGAESLGMLPQIGGASAWSWVFLGAGLGGALLSAISYASQDYANPTTWDWVWAIAFTIMGGAGIASVAVPWWLILIVVGVAVLVSAQRSTS